MREEQKVQLVSLSMAKLQAFVDAAFEQGRAQGFVQGVQSQVNRAVVGAEIEKQLAPAESDEVHSE